MDTPKQKETKKVKRLLRCILTKDELLACGKTQADKFSELVALEGDLKRVTADFKAKIASCEAEMQSMSSKISTGYEFRQVVCTAIMSDPEPTKKLIIRDDTTEHVGVEDMTQEELQRELIATEAK
jgi:roadblock/LC7 domain-containing protein